MRVRVTTALLAFALLAFALLTSGGRAQAKDIDIPYERFVLDNGLTVIVHEDHKAPIVAVNVWYYVGSKNERPGKTGFAHLFEHLMFGGSEHAKGRYIDAMERIGATNLNGTTNSDRTNYFENVPTPALDYALWMESDRMGHMLGALDRKTLDLQRGVVQNEKRQGENEPYGIVDELITKNTYPAGHPYSWTVIGEMADLEAASMNDVREWFKTYYGPTNAVLVLAGDIDAKTAREKVTKYFGDIPPGPPVAHQGLWIAKMTGTHRAVVQDRVPHARVYKVWNIPQYGGADADYLGLVSACLSQGKTSRLYKRLVYDDQIAASTSTFAAANAIGGQFYIVLTARQEKDVALLEKEADEELAKFVRDGPTADELERVKTQYEATLIRSLEQISGKADRLAKNEVFLRNPDAYKSSLKRMREATAEELKSAASRWLSDGMFVLEVHPFPQYKATASVADRSKAPDTGTPPGLRMPKIERATLSSGLKIILAERHEVPLVEFRLVVDAGHAADPRGLPGTSSMAMALLNGGTTSRNALEISDQLALLGAQFGAGSNLDSSFATLSALKSKLEPSLELYADLILHPSFPEGDFRRQQKQQLARIKLEENTPYRMAFRVLPKLLYGQNHPYGAPLTGSGTTESVTKMTREDLLAFYRTWFRPNNAALVVVGDTTLAEITPMLEKLLAGWEREEVPKKDIEQAPLPPKSLVYLIDWPGSPQSMIMVGSIAPPKANPEEIAIEAMNNGLGGMFSSRINLNLREDKHWSYGAGSSLFDARGQRPFMAYASVQTDKTKESMAEIVKEFRDILGTRPLTEKELKDIQSHETLRLPGSKETLNAVGAAIVDLVQFGLPDDYYETYADKVRALTVRDVEDAARTVVHPDNLIWVVVGDRARIEPAVRELKLGELRFLSPDGKPSGTADASDAVATGKAGRPLAEIDVIRIEELHHITDVLGEQIWPGFDTRKTPVAVNNDDREELLIGHPTPPKEFHPFQDFNLGGRAVMRREGVTRYGPHGGGWAVPIAGRPTAYVSILQDCQSMKVYLSLILHECFHCFQKDYRQPADGGPGDPKVMVHDELPLDDPVYSAMIGLESRVLKAALDEQDNEKARNLASMFVAVRHERRKGMPKNLVVFEGENEYSEGTATYCQARAYQLLAERGGIEPKYKGKDPQYHGFPKAKEEYARMISGILAPENELITFFHSMYHHGMAQCLLLDRLRPSWKKEMSEKGMTQFAQLEKELPLTENAEKDLLAEAQNRFDYHNLLAKQRTLVEDRLALIRRFVDAPGRHYRIYHGKIKAPFQWKPEGPVYEVPESLEKELSEKRKSQQADDDKISFRRSVWAGGIRRFEKDSLTFESGETPVIFAQEFLEWVDPDPKADNSDMEVDAKDQSNGVYTDVRIKAGGFTLEAERARVEWSKDLVKIYPLD